MPDHETFNHVSPTLVFAAHPLVVRRPVIRLPGDKGKRWASFSYLFAGLGGLVLGFGGSVLKSESSRNCPVLAFGNFCVQRVKFGVALFMNGAIHSPVSYTSW